MKRFNSRILGTLSLMVLSMSLSQCSCSDVVGSVFVSEADELKLGQQFDTDLRANKTDYPLYSSTDGVQAYVQSVFDKVIAQIPKDEKPSYPIQKVQMIDKPSTVNAFAVPGGYIYVYTGLFTALNSENELAAVLAHEITHVTHHHYRDQLAKQYGVQTLVTMLGGDASTVSAVAQSLLALKFSRDDEADADKGGTTLAGAAGYNPLGVATFFNRQQTSIDVSVLSDHPSNADRVAAVKSQISSTASLKALAYNADGSERTDDLELVGGFSTIKAKF